MLAQTVREAAGRFGPAVAFHDPDGTTLTFADLDRRSDALAAALARDGVGPGARVALRLASTSHYVLAYAGAAKLGAVTAGISPVLAPAEQDALVDLIDPAVVVDSAAAVDEYVRRGELRAPPPPLPPDEDRPVAIVFTSGTTGRPKAAMFAQRQLRAAIAIDTGDRWATEAGQPTLASTQFAHVGFMTKLPWYLRSGLCTYIQARWRARDTLELIADRRIATVTAVAPQLALLLRVPDFDAFDLSAVRMIVAGAAPAPPTLIDQARRRFGVPYCVRYSSTESGGCGLGTAPDADDDEVLRSVGRPRPGIEAAVRADDGRTPVGPDEVGELWLRTPTAMSGYWRDPDATARTLVEGWVRTGDLARVDGRGLVRLAGRRSEMYIRGGYNVYPAEVEAAILAHPAVAECAVVARPDPVMGEVGVAVVVARDTGGPVPDAAGLRGFLDGRIAAYKHPVDVRVVEALPLTAAHKLDRARLLRSLADDAPG